jgi:hypothetical protein
MTMPSHQPPMHHCWQWFQGHLMGPDPPHTTHWRPHCFHLSLTHPNALLTHPHVSLTYPHAPLTHHHSSLTLPHALFTCPHALSRTHVPSLLAHCLLPVPPDNPYPGPSTERYGLWGFWLYTDCEFSRVILRALHYGMLEAFHYISITDNTSLSICSSFCRHMSHIYPMHSPWSSFIDIYPMDLLH